MTVRGAVRGLLVVAWLGIAPSSAALAQTAAAAKDESARTEQARQLYMAGVKEAARGKWEQARVLFAKAFELKQHFQIALSLGQAELKMGKYIEAAEHLTFFLKEVQGGTEDDRRTGREMFDEARRHVGTLHVKVARAGAEVLVDGVSLGTAPVDREVFVAPGQRVIEARLEGFPPAREERTVTAGNEVRVELRLVKVAEPPPLPVAELGIEAGAGAKRGAEVPPSVGSERSKTLIYAGIGVSAGLAVVGTGMAIGAAVKSAASQHQIDQFGGGDSGRDKCSADAACANSYNDLQRQWSALATASVYMFVGAAVIGAGTGVYTLIQSQSPRQAQVSMVVTPQGGGVILRGSW